MWFGGENYPQLKCLFLSCCCLHVRCLCCQQWNQWLVPLQAGAPPPGGPWHGKRFCSITNVEIVVKTIIDELLIRTWTSSFAVCVMPTPPRKWSAAVLFWFSIYGRRGNGEMTSPLRRWRPWWRREMALSPRRVYLSVCLPVCLFTCLSAYLSVYLSVCLSVCLPVCLLTCLSV